MTFSAEILPLWGPRFSTTFSTELFKTNEPGLSLRRRFGLGFGRRVALGLRRSCPGRGCRRNFEVAFVNPDVALLFEFRDLGLQFLPAEDVLNLVRDVLKF